MGPLAAIDVKRGCILFGPDSERHKHGTVYTEIILNNNMFIRREQTRATVNERRHFLVSVRIFLHTVSAFSG